jgi:hypothetical protein
MFVAVLAFALQSYIAQTHIHDSWQAAGGSASLAATQSHQQGKLPFDHGRADCPFCQAVLHVGAALTSPTTVLTLPSVWVLTTPLMFTARADSVSAAHDWKSRAPPRR